MEDNIVQHYPRQIVMVKELIEKLEQDIALYEQNAATSKDKNLHYLIPTLDIKSSKRGLRGLPNKMQIVYNLRILLIKK